MAIFKFYDTSAEMDAELDTNDILSVEFYNDGTFTILNSDGLFFSGNDSDALKGIMGEPKYTIDFTNDGSEFCISIYGDYDDVNEFYKESSGIDLDAF